MAERNSRASFSTLVPRFGLAMARRASARAQHERVEGSLLSADISGFTRLTESLGQQGRRGAEIVSDVVNSCFTDLIAAAEWHGGDVIKFGGDAVLVLFVDEGHAERAIAAAREMQFALRRNPQARRNELRMTVGVNDGPFDVMLVGRRLRDLLVCGPNTTETLELEAAAESGEVVASTSIMAAAGPVASRGGGMVVLSGAESMIAAPAATADDAWERELVAEQFVPASLRAHYADYADLGAEHRLAGCGFVMIDGVDAMLASRGGQATATHLSDLLDSIADRIEPTGVTLLHSDMAPGGVKLLLGAGVPSSIDESADALVHAALAISRIETDFVLRQGLNMGRVFAGFLGAPHRRTFTVMADLVNTAARMLGPAGPGEIVAVSDLTTRTRGSVGGVELEPFFVKGKREPIVATKVESIGPSRSATEQRIELVGRDAELKALDSAISAGEGVTIVGPVGSGKTRLGEELVRDLTTVEGTGGRYMIAAPYGPFWAALRSLAGIDPYVAPTEAGAAVVSYLESNHPTLTSRAGLIAPVFGAEVPDSAEVAALGPEFRRDALHRAITELLAAQMPPIAAVLIDDTHWLDDASSELISYLDAVSARHGWAVVRSRRGSGDADRAHADGAGDAIGVRVELGPLDDGAVEAIIVEACPRRLLRHELDRLIERAQGNPLFAIELGMAASKPGAELPGTIEELIIGRIDRLPPRHRRSVLLASVLGTRFDTGQFAALAQASGGDVEHDLAEIDEIFEIADGRVEFRQLVYREAAYASLPFARRKRLHRVVGDHLEATVDDLDSIASLLSEHFRLAEDRRRTWAYSTQAARRAARQNSPSDAEVLYRRALDFAPRGLVASDRSDALRGLGECLLRTGGLEEAHTLFGKARKVTDDPREALDLVALQGRCRDRQGRFADAMRTYKRLLNAATDYPEAQTAAHNGRASVLFQQGRSQECFAEAQAARAVAVDAGLEADELRACMSLHNAGDALGLVDAGDYAERALTLARSLGLLSEEAEVLNNLGANRHLLGDLDAAAEAYRRAQQLKEQVGDRRGAALVNLNLAEVELDRGVVAGVDAMLEFSIAEFDAAGFTVGSTYGQGLLGRHALASGRPAQALSLLGDAAAAFAALGAESSAGDMELMLVEAHLDLGDVESGERMLGRVRERLDTHVFDSYEATAERILTLDARLSQLRG